MNAKLLNTIAILLILTIGVLYMRSSVGLGIGTAKNMDAGFYPSLLGGILIILTALSFIQTMKKNDKEKVEFPNGKLTLLTIGVIGLFILSWSLLGFFYIHLFLFLYILYSLYSERFKKEFIFKNSFFAATVTFSIFVIFNIVLKLPL
ncbi:MAG: tripartite tricarboxylate transporter TctB family protein [Bacillota bacterium]